MLLNFAALYVWRHADPLDRQLPKYEVLVGDPRALRWVDARGRLSVQNLGARPVEGGREKDGTPLFVARVQHGANVIPGKVSEKLDGACPASSI